MTDSESSIAQIAQVASLLLHARAPANADAQASALAREAARLLNVESVHPATDGGPPVLTAFERQRAAQSQAKSAGLMSRLREIFGAKKS